VGNSTRVGKETGICFENLMERILEDSRRRSETNMKLQHRV
jgi:hypothetical protein